MSAIAWFLETEGLQTTGISLVREHTASLKPPRFLWTSFPLGRPLGKPNDAAFQHRVIDAALDLLDRPEGPVLEDFPEDLPDPPDVQAVCPIHFARPQAAPGSWQQRLTVELSLTSPWYELSRQRRGRTTFGVAKAPIEALVARLAHAIDQPPVEPADLAALKYALEDLKTYYQEAITAQPGHPDFRLLQQIVWRQTELGRAMLALYDRFAAHPDARLRGFARGIAPRGESGHDPAQTT